MPEERTDPYVAVVVRIPEDYFSDEDEICLEAATYVCTLLEEHLIQDGHTVPEWYQGGCSEDWGVYFETILSDEKIEYGIMFFPEEKGAEQRSIMVRYLPWQGFWKSLFFKQPDLAAAHPLHESMERFGKQFESYRMLTQSQLDQEY
ncbi:hypothetical protein V6x_16820 [Gimesia chilikensis]|uniref:Uncharacterized protein n=1 Tax=Gimesia chilikensis TaxID=2605989 RepID=A0A517W9S4_9PLAN|nr:hypothetical protein [Gimesia chilikensis]KAA0142988.1 hypothetical protein FYZ48_01055 [Gimesia chilikensis]QDU01998.1 hypothetical protein V6x_16820 [Gimesia chilikensis]